MSEVRTYSLLELLINVSREVATVLDLRTVLQRLIFASIQHVGGARDDSLGGRRSSHQHFTGDIHVWRRILNHTMQALQIWVESKVDKGSTFFVTLPIAR